MKNTKIKKTSFKTPDIAEKYLQLKAHDKHDMLEDIAYVYPKGNEPIFTVNAYKYNHGNHNIAILGLTLSFILFFPLTIQIGAAPAFALLLVIISSYCAVSVLREKNRDFQIEPNHPEIAVFNHGVWFFRYHTFVPYDRFFRVWVVKGRGLQIGGRQLMFEIYLNNEDLGKVIERREIIGYETFYIDKNLHHKTKLNDILSIRLPYRDGGMDHTHDEIVEKISALVKNNAYENALPVDIGIEKKVPVST
tara:strand:+ start:7613 stop:8359 length:747 start_codon:yes stop_codon:yes gene_type:complete